MIRRALSRFLAWVQSPAEEPNPYTVLRAEYAAARVAFEDAKARRDTRDMRRWLDEQSRLLPEILRLEMQL